MPADFPKRINVEVATHCPYCGLIDHSPLDLVAEGDGENRVLDMDVQLTVVLCGRCGETAILDGDPPRLREPTEREILEISLDEEVKPFRERQSVLRRRYEGWGRPTS
jgi:predicted nucleic-acid-binding Zn-ribbon protein